MKLKQKKVQWITPFVLHVQGVFFYKGDMRLITLSDGFYSEYGTCTEILKKKDLPYYCVAVKIDNHSFAIPLRHHIRHAFAFFTIDDAGLDYTKAVLIDDSKYVSNDSPRIDSAEWNILRGNEDRIFNGFKRFIRQYRRALRNPDNPRSQKYLKFCSLQYFDLN